jgi:hypothetical protein
MSTATQAPPPQAPTADAPFDLTIDLVSRMVETGLIPRDRRIYLQDGRLYENETYRPGQALPLVIDGQEVARIPFDELLR